MKSHSILHLFNAACLLLLTFASLTHADAKLNRVLLEDFDNLNPVPKAGVVNMPESNAIISLSTDHLSTDRPFQGKQCLKLHYHFTANGQYLVIPLDLKVDAPIHTLHFMLFGDASGLGYGVYLLDASGETHKFRDAATMSITHQGWKEISIDLDANHETWGGDKNGKLDFPLTGLTFEISTPGHDAQGNIYFAAIAADSEKSAAQTKATFIGVTSPEYGAEIKGDTTINIAAPGFTKITATSWKPNGKDDIGRKFGTDTKIADIDLDDSGKGSFVFPANDFPHGPITVTLTGDKNGRPDHCFLQLYNNTGVKWNEGLPKEAPPGAQGLQLVFADDFTKMPSISSTDLSATYYDHKPPNGSQDFSSIPFTSASAPNNPFKQMDTFLRIRVSDQAKSAGLISSLKNDGSGVKVAQPCYFECRFIAQSAIGSWPAFWLLSDNISKPINGCDELDIIEAVGGEGPTAPNASWLYQITPHAWAQGDAARDLETNAYKDMKNPCDMRKFGIPSSWHNTFHTYGCRVNEDWTTYYCDNIEVGRHHTLPMSKYQPMFFLINNATGGGWPVDLSRYHGISDMYVDFVRVYAAKK